MKSENNYDDMIEILEHLHQYVPTATGTIDLPLPDTEEKMTISKTDFHTLIFGGDQLTAKRARGGQTIRANSVEDEHKLFGLLPAAEDWHAKVALLSVSEVFQY